MNRGILVGIALVGAVFGFLLNSNAPIGSQLWPVASGTPQPEGSDLGLLMVMGGIEALAFGIGAAFLVAAWPWVKSRGAGALTWPVYLSVAWVLMNWVVHTGLHMNHGNINSPADFGGLVGIEYGFHFTLIIAGSILATHVIRVMRGTAAAQATR